MRKSARKVRVVLDLIRGKQVEEAYRILSFTRKAAAETVLKLLRSAVANANQKEGHAAETLYVSRTFADGGLYFERFEPKAMLRHGIQKRRTCHVTIELSTRLVPAGAPVTSGPGTKPLGKPGAEAKT